MVKYANTSASYVIADNHVSLQQPLAKQRYRKNTNDTNKFSALQKKHQRYKLIL